MKILALFFFLVSLTIGLGAEFYNHIYSGNKLEGPFSKAPEGYEPEVYIIETSNGWGSGYPAKTELGNGIVTVGHVIGDDMEIFIYPHSDQLIPWESYTCQNPGGDGPCFIKLVVDPEPSFVRIPDLDDYSDLEFVVWDKDRNLWLPFLLDPYKKCIEGSFCISGQFFDPGTGVEVARVSQGMSGYTPVLAEGGWPVLNQDNLLTALGEITSGASNNGSANVVSVWNTPFTGTDE